MDYYNVESYRPASMQCVFESSIRRNVPANVLLGLIELEGGREGTIRKNRNGTLDLGRVQINSRHLKELQGYGNVPANTVAYYLTFDGCYNIDVAAFLLSRHIASNPDQNFWIRAAKYHSRTPSLNLPYALRLRAASARWGAYLSVHYTTKEYRP